MLSSNAPAVGTIILVPEGDAVIVERDEPAVGDGGNARSTIANSTTGGRWPAFSVLQRVLTTAETWSDLASRARPSARLQSRLAYQ